MKTNKYTGIALLLMMAISTIEVSAQTRNPGRENNRPKEINSRPARQSNTPAGRNIGTINRNNVQFRKEKTKVVVRRQKPAHAERVIYNNRTYDYYDGRFYFENNGRYMQAAPVIGMRIKTLPAIYTNIWFGNNQYYFYQGIYYYPRNGYYEVVTPPVGAIVPALPADYEKVIYNGVMYYEYNGVLYEKINNRQGKGYQVVGYLD